MASEKKQNASHLENLNGNPENLTTERAVEELRRGRVIALIDGDQWLLVAAVETMESPLLERLNFHSGGGLRLIMTPQRSRALRLAAARDVPMAISFPRGVTLEQLRALAGVESRVPIESGSLRVEPADNPASIEAGLRLAKLGKLLPALVIAKSIVAVSADVMTVRARDIQDIRRNSTLPANAGVRLISRARVPLPGAVDSEIVLFRSEYDLGEHLAVMIGEPSAGMAIPVRLHSACLTGDVLGSLRCDCGDQLKRAVGRIASLGRGVLLYLDQEGRGIGLANKLRAYTLQDTGLDTVDADQHLGFLSDERTYEVAASMLHQLGIDRIRLLTNNPHKISALQEYGITVAGRLPLVAAINPHNQRYLEAKLDRAGHLAE